MVYVSADAGLTADKFGIRPEVALVFGGAENVYAEYNEAKRLCAEAGLPFVTAVLNSALSVFPGRVDIGVTLHPENLAKWLPERGLHNLPPVTYVWAHRPATNVARYTRDWGGSCSLFATKVLRTEGFNKIILCGCPMDTAAGHFLRKARWNAALAFRRGWNSHKKEIPPSCLRSMSGWTKEQFSFPTVEWLKEPCTIGPHRPRPFPLKA